jgi:nitrogenase molybdenum-iron protein NifN
MAELVHRKRACSVNPLKTSAPLGAALAYLGIEGAVPLLHGAQGCASFGLVLAVRHFREAIPIQTTAMSEVSAILGGSENLEEALTVIQGRMKPRFIGVASTALTETRAEDFAGTLKELLARRQELAGTAVVFASTPDFEGGLEDGWALATSAIIDALVEPPPAARLASRRVNVLPGVHLTPADLDEVRETIEAFGLEPVFLPDLSGSLDGHVPAAYVGTSLGGTLLADIARMGQAVHTIAIGEQMRAPAERLHRRTGGPYTVLAGLTGLEPTDRLVSLLGRLSGQSAPPALRRRRSQLVDAMLDGHFALSGQRLAIAGDPDLLTALVTCVVGLGAEVTVAVASTDASPALHELPCAEVLVGDLGDLEEAAAARGVDLLIASGHGQPTATRLGVPLFRAGFPIVDRVGTSHRLSVGYRGTRTLVLELANLLLAAHDAPFTHPHEVPHVPATAPGP